MAYKKVKKKFFAQMSEQYNNFMFDQVAQWMEQVLVDEETEVPVSVLRFYFKEKALQSRNVTYLR